jgi:4-hydroxymandelate oxidase
VLAPAGSNRAFHPDAGIAVAKAAKAGNHLQMATTSIEDAIAARGAPVWFQLYTTQRWGIDLGGISSTIVTNLSWDLIKRLRDTVKVKLVLKGILAFEDAKLAADAGIDAIVVSNHGGRVEDGVSATIDVLPEIVRAVGGRMPVLVDSGFRRGSDIVKALALGAQAVCVGRPYLWGLGAFGQPGVERVLAILRAETRNAMAQLGAPSLRDLGPAMVRRV